MSYIVKNDPVLCEPIIAKYNVVGEVWDNQKNPWGVMIADSYGYINLTGDILGPASDGGGNSHTRHWQRGQLYGSGSLTIQCG